MKQIMLVVILSMFSSLGFAQGVCNWTGSWSSTYGELRLIQDGVNVRGDYSNKGTLEGTVNSECELDGSFDNVQINKRGSISFSMLDKRFSGQWKYDGAESTKKWGGTQQNSATPKLKNTNLRSQACNWTGAWSSTYGDLRLIQDGVNVRGDYSNKGTLEGVVNSDCELDGSFDNVQINKRGSISFSMLDKRFSGQWKYDGAESTKKWGGTRKNSETPKLKNTNLRSQACDWTGLWSSSLGDLKLTQNGNDVRGAKRKTGIIKGKSNGCRLKGTIKDQTDDQAQSFTITKTDTRFIGTWSQQGSTAPRSHVWSGNLRSSAAPKSITAKPTPAKPTPPVQNIPVIPDREDNTVHTGATEGIWQITLHSACVANIEKAGGIMLSAQTIDLAGIGWAKASIINKNNGKPVAIAPTSGFPNLNGDLERAWERRTGSNSKGFVLKKTCSMLVEDGLKDGFGTNRAISLNYKINALDYGYADLAELLDDPRNKFRVMFKLKKINPYVDDQLGTQAKSTPMHDADFCGSCNAYKQIQEDGSVQLSLRGVPSGDGVFSKFRNGDDHVVVLYDIKRQK